jgi:hypothetical protein
VNQTQPCPEIGSEVASMFGDVDCDGDIDAVDALKILRFVVGLSVTQTEPCPDVGTEFNVIEVAAESGSPFTKAMPFAAALGLAAAETP